MTQDIALTIGMVLGAFAASGLAYIAYQCRGPSKTEVEAAVAQRKERDQAMLEDVARDYPELVKAAIDHVTAREDVQIVHFLSQQRSSALKAALTKANQNPLDQ